MRSFLTILSLVLTLVVCGQSKKDIAILANTRLLERTVFGTKDSLTLEKLFAKELTYIHSHGKIQNRAEALHGIVSNKSTYDIKAAMDGYTLRYEGDSAISSHILRGIEKKADGTEVQLNLLIELTWIKEGKSWKLTRRKASIAE